MSNSNSTKPSNLQNNAALNPAAKEFVGGGTPTGGSGINNNSSSARAPLPAGESGHSNVSSNGPRPYNPTGPAANNAYQPPAANSVPPPVLHPQNSNPHNYNNNNGTAGHGSSSFYPSHSGGGGGGAAAANHGGVPNRNNFGNNNNNGPASHHHHHHHHHGGGGGNFHHNNNNNNYNGPGGFNNNNNNNFGNNNMSNNNNGPMNHHHNMSNNNNNNNMNYAPHHHHHHHQFHHNQHHHMQSHQMHSHPSGHNTNNNSNNISPNQQNNIPGNFPHPHNNFQQHNFNNNNNMRNMNNNNMNNNNNGGGPLPSNRGRGGFNNNNNNNMAPNMNNNNNNMGNNNNNNMNVIQPRSKPNETRKAVVVLGAPKSGKTTLAKRIAAEMPNFVCIEAPLDKEKFETLTEELKKLSEAQQQQHQSPQQQQQQMLVLDGFGADHDADLFYLSSVLKRYNYAVFGLVYLNLNEPAKTIRSRQEDVAPSTAQMFGHAVAYETCSQYGNSEKACKNFILVQADATRDHIFGEFKKSWEDAAVQQLDVVPPKVLKTIDRALSWKMLPYGEFKQVTSALEATLPSASTGSGSSPLPLRSAYGPLTYPHFARWFARLPKYQVSLMTNGQRIVLFAFNGSLYFLPEHGYYLFRYDPADSPPSASRVTQWFSEISLKCPRPENLCPLVLDAEYVIFQSEEYILLRDVLVCSSEPCHPLPLHERVAKMTNCLYSRPADDSAGPTVQILPHRYASVEKVSEIFAVWDRAEEVDPSNQQPQTTVTKVGVGVRLEPPGEYVLSQHDPNLLFWFDPTRITIVARLWGLEEVDDGQRFQVLGVDDASGIETKLPKECPEKVFIPQDIVLEEQLGEGHIVELTITKRLTNPPPASRGGRNPARSQSEILDFKFERRRWDIAVPNYHSTISSIVHQVRHSWAKDYFKATCELVAHAPSSASNSGEGTPMTPSSPVSNTN